MATWGARNGSGARKAGMDEMFEQENNRMAENLASKVSRLKSIAVDIESETKHQNQYLGGMGTEFESSEGLLGSSAKRLTNMLASGRSNRNLMCYVTLFLVVVFFIAYYAFGKVVVKAD